MVQEALLIVLTVITGVLLFEVYRLRKISKEIVSTKVENEQLTESNRELTEQLKELQDNLGSEKEKNKELLSQKKSSETRLGQIGEHLVPFLDGCPYDPKDLMFLGQPVDFICFDFDQAEITLIEAKTGNSKPSKRQKIIKNIIKSGKINYAELRIDEKGITHKEIKGREELRKEKEKKSKKTQTTKTAAKKKVTKKKTGGK